MYIASVVSFLVQLDAMPPHWPKVEADAFRRLVAGSGQWAVPRDLRHLHLLGFPKSFVDMSTRCRAAQLRVYHLEAANVGGLQVRRRAAALRSSDGEVTRR